MMRITFDPAKRQATLNERGIDFADAAAVFEGPTFDVTDQRFDYGEKRLITFGMLEKRIVTVIWTQRGDARHVISMRKANKREQRDIGSDLAKIDAHVVQSEEYDEIPEWTDEVFDKAIYRVDGVEQPSPPRRGRPRAGASKDSHAPAN